MNKNKHERNKNNQPYPGSGKTKMAQSVPEMEEKKTLLMLINNPRKRESV
jgi:hypothetical protein